MLNNKILHLLASSSKVHPNSRSYKNFGHKRQPIPGVTVLWHSFLAFTFVGLGVEWKRMCGEEEETMEHLMCECHALARQRMKDFGTGYPDPEEFKALPLSSITKHMEMVEKALEVARFMLGDDDVKISWDPTDPVPKE